MNTTEYLYGIKPEVLSNMKYKEALEFKIQKGKEYIELLYKEPMETRDDRHITEIHKAMSFTKTLLEELR